MSLELQWNEVDDEDDEGLQNLIDNFRQRGGKVYLNDEDEEDEEDDIGSGAEAEDDETGETKVEEKGADGLADLMSKVSIN
jgi:Ran GTPase-activating protein 1